MIPDRFDRIYLQMTFPGCPVSYGTGYVAVLLFVPALPVSINMESTANQPPILNQRTDVLFVRTGAVYTNE